MGFNLNVEEYRLPITVYQGSKEFQVIHVLRAPTDDEMEGYAEKISEYDPIAKQYKPNYLAAAVWLWNQLAISVEGYDFEGDFNTIKGKIPFTHKRPAIDAILSIAKVNEDEANFLGQR